MSTPQLIITVRDSHEVRLVIDAAASIGMLVLGQVATRWALDVKQPSLGSLGRAGMAEVDAVLGAVGGRCEVSVAWGELLDDAPRPPLAWHGRVRMIKLGLAGAGSREDWRVRWEQTVRRLRTVAPVVAVTYADAAGCGAPDFGCVVTCARKLACPAVLIDTYDKSQGSLWSHWSEVELTAAIQTIRDFGLRVALAGSLAIDDLPRVAAAEPDFIALRGALCREGRTGTLDPSLVVAALQKIAN